MKEELMSVCNIIHDTVVLLCRNGVTYKGQLKVQGLLGVTLDDEEIFLVPFNEVLTNGNVEESLETNITDDVNCDKQSPDGLDTKMTKNMPVVVENILECMHTRKVSNDNVCQSFTRRRKIRKSRETYLGGAINNCLSGAKILRREAIENSHPHFNTCADVFPILKSSYARFDKDSLERAVDYKIGKSRIKPELSDADEIVYSTLSKKSSNESHHLVDVSLNLKSKLNGLAKLNKLNTNEDSSLCRQMPSSDASHEAFAKDIRDSNILEFADSLENKQNVMVEQGNIFDSNESASCPTSVSEVSDHNVKHLSDEYAAVNGKWHESKMESSAMSNGVFSEFDDTYTYNASRVLPVFDAATSDSSYAIHSTDPFSKTLWQEFSSGPNFQLITAVVRDCALCGERYAWTSERLRLPPVRGHKRTSAEKMKMFRARRKALHGIVMSCDSCKERILALPLKRYYNTMQAVNFDAYNEDRT